VDKGLSEGRKEFHRCQGIGRYFTRSEEGGNGGHVAVLTLSPRPPPFSLRATNVRTLYLPDRVRRPVILDTERETDRVKSSRSLFLPSPLYGSENRYIILKNSVAGMIVMALGETCLNDEKVGLTV
jgi:hypothetical protein